MKKLLLIVGMFFIAANGQPFEKSLPDLLHDAFNPVHTYLPEFDYENIKKCVSDGHTKQDCFSAIRDVQEVKFILKYQCLYDYSDKDLTEFQCYLLKWMENTATVEDLLRFWATPLGKESLEDAQKYGLIKKRD